MAQSSGQEFQTAYESALLDSAYKYELLKPTFFNLKTAYDYQGQQTEHLKKSIQLYELQIGLHKKEYETRMSVERQKRRKWAGAAGLLGLTVGLLIGH